MVCHYDDPVRSSKPAVTTPTASESVTTANAVKSGALRRRRSANSRAVARASCGAQVAAGADLRPEGLDRVDAGRDIAECETAVFVGRTSNDDEERRPPGG